MKENNSKYSNTCDIEFQILRLFCSPIDISRNFLRDVGKKYIFKISIKYLQKYFISLKRV